MEETDIPAELLAQQCNDVDPLQVQGHMTGKPKGTNFKWQFDNDFRSNHFPTEKVDINGWSSLPNIAMETSFNDASSIGAASKGPARSICNPLEAWMLLLDEPLLTVIMQKTNNEIRLRRGKGAHERSTDLLELRAFFGLNYLTGLFRNSGHAGPLDELWSLELGNAVFRVTMSIQRYEFLSRCMRLTSKANELNQKLSEVWNKFIINCRSYYSPSAYVVLDMDAVKEELVMCDAQTLYLHNKMKVKCNNLQISDISELVGDIKGSGRIVINETKQNSLELADLLKSHDLALVGVLNKNNKSAELETICNEYYAHTMYKNHLSLYEGNLLTSCVSSLINAKELFETTHDACKKLYKSISIYGTNFGTPVEEHGNKFLTDCQHLLNYAAHNAWVLMRLSVAEGVNMEYRDFLRCLGLYLTQQHIRRKLEHPERLSMPQKVMLSEMLDEPLEKVPISKPEPVKEISVKKVLPIPEGTILKSRIAEKRTRCRKCKGKNSPKTRVRCQQCLRSLCHRHIIFRCDDCTGVTELNSICDVNEDAALDT